MHGHDACSKTQVHTFAVKVDVQPCLWHCAPIGAYMRLRRPAVLLPGCAAAILPTMRLPAMGVLLRGRQWRTMRISMLPEHLRCCYLQGGGGPATQTLVSAGPNHSS